MKPSTHTPTPWKVADNCGNDYAANIIEADGHLLANTAWGNMRNTKERRANAELIVRAVNVHQELLAYAKSFHVSVIEHAPGSLPKTCSMCATICRAEPS